MSLREQILASMARTLFVTAYADACDEYDGARGELPAYSAKWAAADRAVGGQDWMDVAPDAEEFDAHAAADARSLAIKMLAEFERLNSDDVLQVLDDSQHNAETVGHYIAMQSLGHGVGLHDEWKTAYFEGINL